jgi:transposase
MRAAPALSIEPSTACGVECLINRLKQRRRVATRDEKRAANYSAMICLAAIMRWL